MAREHGPGDDVDRPLLVGVLRVTAGPGPPRPAFEGDGGLDVVDPDIRALPEAARLLVPDSRADPGR